MSPVTGWSANQDLVSCSYWKFHPVPSRSVHMRKISIQVAEISAAKTDFRLLIRTHRKFYDGKSGEPSPARLTGLMKRPLSPQQWPVHVRAMHVYSVVTTVFKRSQETKAQTPDRIKSHREIRSDGKLITLSNVNHLIRTLAVYQKQINDLLINCAGFTK